VLHAGPIPSPAMPPEWTPQASSTPSGSPRERGRAKWRTQNQRHGRRSLSLEGPGPKAFKSNVCDVCFPRHFQVPSNIIKYDGKTNPSVFLEDFHLTCRVGEAGNDLFTIQFLPVYLANTCRAWLDHLPRNSINCLEDLKDIFTSTFQGTYVRPSNP
jgi:hypothetical protein